MLPSKSSSFGRVQPPSGSLGLLGRFLKNPPYFPFYAADWLSDEHVQSMTVEEEGCYVRLLCYCWREGSIPADGSAILQLCKRGVAELSPSLLERFPIDPNNPSRRFNPKLRELREAQIEHRKERSESGLRGAKERWKSHKSAIGSAIGSAINQPLAKNGLSSSLSESTERESVSVPPMSREEYDREFSTRPWSKEFLEYWWNELDGVCHWKPKNCEFPLDRKGVGSWLANRWPGWQSVKAKGNGSPPKESAAQREARIATQEREADEQKRKEIAEAKALGAQPMGNFLNKFKEEEAKREKRMQNPNYHPDA